MSDAPGSGNDARDRPSGDPAPGNEAPDPAAAFDDLVTAALDALPQQFLDVLKDVPVIVSDRGAEFHAYGRYYGGTVARDHIAARIVIYRDTLTRDFGHDPELLRRQVERTVRHELGHHLGFGEDGVRGLGL